MGNDELLQAISIMMDEKLNNILEEKLDRILDEEVRTN